MSQFGLNFHLKEKFNQDFIKMQKMLETSSYERFDLSNGQISIQKLEQQLHWDNWISIDEESRCFLERQILDLNTTTQTTSRNNESISAKKKDSELMLNSFHKSNIIKEKKLNNTVLGVKVKNISEVKMHKILMTNSQQVKKTDFLKKLIHSNKNINLNKITKNQIPNKKETIFDKLEKHNKQRKLSEIPNNTVLSENEEIPEEQNESLEMSDTERKNNSKLSNNKHLSDEKEHQWNGMTNSISDLRETTIINESNNNFKDADHISEEPDSAFKENQKSIFLKEGEEELSIDSNLQTPEFREASQKQGFYPNPKMTSNRVLYECFSADNSEKDSFKKKNLENNFNENNYSEFINNNSQQINNYRSNDCEDASAFQQTQNIHQ